MPYDPQKHHRRSIRLPGYDYSQPGEYYVTIVAQDRLCQFGEIIEEQMRLNPAGEMIWNWWKELPRKFGSVRMDTAVVMPNHFHGIISIVGAPLCGCPEGPPRRMEETQAGHPRLGHPRRGAPTVGDIVDWFKTMTTNAYIRKVKQQNWPPFNGKLWQRNYYEHMIRNERELNRIRDYIIQNPYHWDEDPENPNKKSTIS